jgi:predicted dehydrogenase
MTQANTYGGRSTTLEGTPFRVALIGAGGIANAHYKGYTAAGAVIVGFVDPFELTRARREVEWKIKGYSSFDELLAAEDFEAVSICTPNAFHAPSTIRAAKAGKHVLCEKPLSMSLEDCQKMIDAAADANVVLQTGHHLRANLLVEKSKELISSGAIGRVTFIRLRQTHDWGGNKTIADSFGKLANSGGGTLLDNGCHMFDLARNLGGNVKNIFARTATLGFDVEVEDVGTASLEFESGALGSVESSWTATGWEEGWWVYGTDGALECTNRLGTRKLRHAYRTSSGTDWNTLDETMYSFADEGGHSREIIAFINSVRHGTPVICTGRDGLESVRLVLKAYESAKVNQPLEL